MKIQQIRDTIQNAFWARDHFTGGTSEENRRINLPEQLAPHRAALVALEIAPRFTKEIERRKEQIQYIDAVIARWHENQKIIQFPRSA